MDVERIYVTPRGASLGKPEAWPVYCSVRLWAEFARSSRLTMPPNIPTYSKTPGAGVNCWQCRFFATSWDPALPYSCKLLGFKSRNLPCMQVLQLDGRPCQGFEPKPTWAQVSANRQ